MAEELNALLQRLNANAKRQRHVLMETEKQITAVQTAIRNADQLELEHQKDEVTRPKGR